jgi:mediator of RNA polymerase II transcription subunit 21
VAPQLPPSQEEFQRDIRDLSRDLLLKEQQIKILIGSPPGLNASEKEQIKRIEDLEQQLGEIKGERLAAVKGKEALVRVVEGKIRSNRRGPVRDS